jgi:hypothetical protein
MGAKNEQGTNDAAAFLDRLSHSVPISTTVFAVYFLMAALSWRTGGTRHSSPSSTLNLVQVLVYGYAIVMLILLARVFRDWRSRVLLLLPAARILVDLIARLFPSALEPAKDAIKVGSHVLWSICVTVSLSFVVVAIRNALRPQVLRH